MIDMFLSFCFLFVALYGCIVLLEIISSSCRFLLRLLMKRDSEKKKGFIL